MATEETIDQPGKFGALENKSTLILLWCTKVTIIYTKYATLDVNVFFLKLFCVIFFYLLSF